MFLRIHPHWRYSTWRPKHLCRVRPSDRCSSIKWKPLQVERPGKWKPTAAIVFNCLQVWWIACSLFLLSAFVHSTCHSPCFEIEIDVSVRLSEHNDCKSSGRFEDSFQEKRIYVCIYIYLIIYIYIFPPSFSLKMFFPTREGLSQREDSESLEALPWLQGLRLRGGAVPAVWLECWGSHIWVCLKIGDTHIHSNFNGEHGDTPLEYEIHYFQTNPYVWNMFWLKRLICHRKLIHVCL